MNSSLSSSVLVRVRSCPCRTGSRRPSPARTGRPARASTAADAGRAGEQLRLEGRARPAAAGVAVERVGRLVDHQRRVQPCREPLGERGLADAGRALDRDVPMGQGSEVYLIPSARPGRIDRPRSAPAAAAVAAAFPNGPPPRIAPMLRRDGRAVRREERRPAAALALAVAAMLVLAQTACKETAPPVLVPPQPTFAEDSGAIIRLEDLRVLRDAADSPRDLTAIAKRTDARLRRRAAFALGRVGDVAGRPALEALLGDAEPAVRQAAAFGLGLLGDKAAVPALLAALNGDASPMVRGARRGSARPDWRRVGGRADWRLRHDAHWRRRARQRPARRAWVAAHARGRRLSSRHLRAGAAQGGGRAPAGDCGRRGEAAERVVADRLRAASHRRSADARADAGPAQGERVLQRRVAAQGLGVSKQPAIAVPPLLDVLASATPRPAVRLEAVRGLGRLGDARAVTPLVALLDDSTLDPAMQAEVVTALGALKAQPAVDRLLDRLGDPSPTVRAAAVTALAAIEGREFLQVLSGVDPIPTGRCASPSRPRSVRSATRCPRRRGSRIWTTPTGAPGRRRSGARRRQAPATRATVDRLLRARLTNEDVIVRATAAEIIGEARPADAAAVLTAAWQASKADVDIDARVAILEALVAMKADTARDGAHRGPRRSRLGGAAQGARDAADGRSRVDRRARASGRHPPRPAGVRGARRADRLAAGLHRHLERLDSRSRSPSSTRQSRRTTSPGSPIAASSTACASTASCPTSSSRTATRAATATAAPATRSATS